MRKISIGIKDVELKANLLDTVTADAIYDALPIMCSVNVWGEELYFEIPVTIKEEAEAKEIVEIGDLAFWPMGSAFCIFFGRTPVSTDSNPRAVSPVNVFGKLEGNIDVLKNVVNGDMIQVKRLY